MAARSPDGLDRRGALATTTQTRRRTPLLRLQEAGERLTERHATWTELFFDLVFVAAVGQLAAGLHHEVSFSGAITFLGLFAPVWWTWTTYAYVADLFDADEGPFRFVLIGAMLFAGGLAATIPAAFGGHTVAFVIAYALLRADLIAIYLWAWITDPRLRRLVGIHAVGFSIGGAIWLGSLFVTAPARYAIWALAIAIDLITGLVAYLRDPDVPRHRSHMPERFGLFTLIVLGESVIAVSAATARSSWTILGALTAALGFGIAAALWWMYFARFDETVFEWAFEGGPAARRRSFVFGYGHLLVFAALAAVGVGVRLGVEQALDGTTTDHAAAVLGISLAFALVALSLIQSAAPQGLPAYAFAGRAAITVASIATAALGSTWNVGTVMGVLAGGLCAAVALEETVGRRQATAQQTR
jgi:low temperature requirement protein LtrA